jgi:hypothetical protein
MGLLHIYPAVQIQDEVRLAAKSVVEFKKSLKEI